MFICALITLFTLLLPSDTSAGACPAVLLLHDHGAWFSIGEQKMQRTPESADWVDRLYSGISLADSLVQKGYVVLMDDAPFWGEKNPYKDSLLCRLKNEKAVNKELKQLQQRYDQYLVDEYGITWADSILHNDLVSLDFLFHHPLVDTARIYTVGLSMGAYRAWNLAAQDNRVAGCAAFRWMTAAPQVGYWIQPMESYAKRASLISPRPFLLVMGATDHLFPINEVRVAVDSIKTAYFVPDKFTYREVEAGHVFTYTDYRYLLRFLDGTK